MKLLAFIAEGLARPEAFEDIQAFVEAASSDAVVSVFSEARVLLFRHAAKANTEDQPPAG